MDLKLIITGDGSHTLFLPGLNEQYHSTFGAVQESRHVYIQTGLLSVTGKNPISLFEVGFGTGLNAFLTLIEAGKFKIHIEYTAIEPFPPDPDLIRTLNYSETVNCPEFSSYFQLLHDAPWNEPVWVTEFFRLKKINERLDEILLPSSAFDLVYYDAFAPDVQPELWTVEIFSKLALSLKPAGVLVTYSSKGAVKRALQAAGFAVEKLSGPPGKRHILRAVKNGNQ